MSSPQWVPCEIHLKRGSAKFDGIKIQADPIIDPRRDRVFPIVEEEQVFVCREMYARLEDIKQNGKCPLILDIGTGSGVFAIWAVKNGLSAWGIDLSSRAIMRACENAKMNGIIINELPVKNEKCHLWFSHDTFNTDFTQKHRHEFDVVLVNPPYHPTCPGMHPALHAEAGEDGQEAFKNQIALVPDVLKPGGYCIGNQFTTIDFNGNINALHEIDKAFNEQCKIRFMRMIPSDISARKFLEGVYETYLNEAEASAKDNVNKFINRLAALITAFTLIYFEIKNFQNSEKLSFNERCFEFKPIAYPPRGWDDRINFHRYVTDFTS